jgi:RNA polymerase sigma factor (sigma-70 family)
MGTTGLLVTLPQSARSPGIASTLDRDDIVADLFDAHAAGLYRLALAMLRDQDEAQDVVQDTFIRLIAHVRADGSLPNARGWLYTVAAHRCRDRQRRLRRWLPWIPEGDRRLSADRPDARERQDVVFDAIRALRPRDRLLVALRAQGLSYHEIATAARVRPASVGRLLVRALDRLAAQMNKES